jgi:hypothetical protein
MRAELVSGAGDVGDDQGGRHQPSVHTVRMNNHQGWSQQLFRGGLILTGLMGASFRTTVIEVGNLSQS